MAERRTLDTEAAAIMREILDLSPEDMTDEYDDPEFPPLLMERIKAWVYTYDLKEHER